MLLEICGSDFVEYSLGGYCIVVVKAKDICARSCGQNTGSAPVFWRASLSIGDPTLSSGIRAKKLADNWTLPTWDQDVPRSAEGSRDKEKKEEEG